MIERYAAVVAVALVALVLVGIAAPLAWLCWSVLRRRAGRLRFAA